MTDCRHLRVTIRKNVFSHASVRLGESEDGTESTVKPIPITPKSNSTNRLCFVKKRLGADLGRVSISLSKHLINVFRVLITLEK